MIILEAAVVFECTWRVYPIVDLPILIQMCAKLNTIQLEVQWTMD